ncbi:hypothetical protein CYMTET_54254 [Cymbomonas tetramitiformis]|uniref:ATP-dependent DNA helicase n=1 Tax=Cymbomonas tetramitiformis TaxID=36881 RepID=A0AAE0BFK0_9CHLO|nr:hypothetical protein CYMTET_54254 [Cymbomonas tetramitiformis]
MRPVVVSSPRAALPIAAMLLSIFASTTASAAAVSCEAGDDIQFIENGTCADSSLENIRAYEDCKYFLDKYNISYQGFAELQDNHVFGGCGIARRSLSASGIEKDYAFLNQYENSECTDKETCMCVCPNSTKSLSSSSSLSLDEIHAQDEFDPHAFDFAPTCSAGDDIELIYCENSPITNVSDCQAYAIANNFAFKEVDQEQRPPFCTVSDEGATVYFNSALRLRTNCSEDHECLCNCARPLRLPALFFIPPPPLPPPPTFSPSPPFPLPPIGLPESPPPFNVTDETAINHFDIEFVGIDPYNVLRYSSVGRSFKDAYKNVLLTYLPGLTESQIAVTKVMGNLTAGSESVTVGTRMTFNSNNPAAITPAQTIAWFSTPSALARFNETLYSFGTHRGSAVTSLNMVMGEEITVMQNVDENDDSLTVLQILHANLVQNEESFAFVKDMSQFGAVVNEQALNGVGYEYLMIPSLVDSMAQLVSTVTVDGAANDPIESPETALTCGDASLDMGILTDHTLCFLSCAMQSKCVWAGFDVDSKACVGGTTVCSYDTLVNATGPQRVAIKIRDEEITHENVKLHDGAYLSALSNVYRPIITIASESSDQSASAGDRRLLEEQDTANSDRYGVCEADQSFQFIERYRCDLLDLGVVISSTKCKLAKGSDEYFGDISDESLPYGCVRFYDTVIEKHFVALNKYIGATTCSSSHECACACPTAEEKSNAAPPLTCADTSNPAQLYPVVGNGAHVESSCGKAGFLALTEDECKNFALDVLKGEYSADPLTQNIHAFGCQVYNGIVVFHSNSESTVVCEEGRSCVCKCPPRPTYEKKGLSCLLSGTSGEDQTSVAPCTWTAVSGMNAASYQHPSTGTGNVYELTTTGVESLFSGDRLCPGVGSMKGISLAKESRSLKTASCASYLSNDLQSFFAVMVWSNIDDDSTAVCYLLSTCGGVGSPMTTYEEEFGVDEATTPRIAVLAKDSVLPPSAVDADVAESLSLAAAAMSVGNRLYADFVARASAAFSFVSSADDCLLNHHALYDSSEYAASSVCLPRRCSIWGTEPGYRSTSSFFEDTCSAENLACCANAHETAAPCSAGKKTTACMAVDMGDIQLPYNEIEYFEIVETFAVPNSEFIQKKRAQSDALKHDESAMIPTCTVKLDVYSDDSYSLEASGVKVLRAASESDTSDAMHVSRACPLLRPDPRFNELVVSAGKGDTHVSRTPESAGPLRVSLMSSLMPYSGSKVHIPVSFARTNFDNMITDTTQRGTGLLDPRRPTDVVWRAADSEERRATYIVPGTTANEDGISFADAYETPRRSPYHVSPRAGEGTTGRFELLRRVVEGSSEKEGVSMCFTLCQSDTAFRIADKAGTSEGVMMAYFSHDEAVRQNGVTDEDNVGSVKIAGVEYHYAEYRSLTPTAFDDMHLPRESDALVLEIREATDDKDYQRMTFRTLDKQNAVRQGAACVQDVPLKFGKTYDVTLQTFKSGAASDYTEPLCVESAADEQTSATVVAPYGMAASKIDGQTVDSVFPEAVSVTDASACRVMLARMLNRDPTSSRWTAVRALALLVIDEVSTLTVTKLEMLDLFFRTVRRCPERFMGGVRVMLCGDFLQLDPVGDERIKLHEHELLARGEFRVVLLEDNMRQFDEGFRSLLARARVGELTDEDRAALDTRRVEEPPRGRFALQVCHSRRRAFDINNAELAATPDIERVFVAIKRWSANADRNAVEWTTRKVDDPHPSDLGSLGDRLREMCERPNVQAVKRCALRVGARVMLNKNLYEHEDPRMRNGRLGIVRAIEFPEDGITNSDETVMLSTRTRVMVAFDDDASSDAATEVRPTVARHSMRVAGTSQRCEVWCMPLTLAWAVTVYKAQGCELRRLVVHCDDLYKPKHLYVALSRCRALEGLFLLGASSGLYCHADDRDIEFYRALHKNGGEWDYGHGMPTRRVSTGDDNVADLSKAKKRRRR